MTEIRIAVIGPGRMGSAAADLARANGAQVVATLGPSTPITRDSLNHADVAIAFTEPSAATGNIVACVAAGCPIVVGTTGWYEQLPEITRYVSDHHGSVLWAANFSLGVAALALLIRRAGELLNTLPGFEPALIETHHSAKKDAPSGTAKMLQREFEAASGRELHVTSVRVGSVPGTHTLVLDGAFEQIAITHEARDRRVFAEGALLAARWLIGRTGMFTLDDVLAGETDK